MEFYKKFNPKECSLKELQTIVNVEKDAKEVGMSYCPSCRYYIGAPEFKGFEVTCRRYEEFMDAMARLIPKDTVICSSYKPNKEIEETIEMKKKEKR